jgi:hypothetical protein
MRYQSPVAVLELICKRRQCYPMPSLCPSPKCINVEFFHSCHSHPHFNHPFFHNPLVFSGSIWFSGSTPDLSFTGSNAGFPPYNWAPPTWPACSGPPPSSSWLTLIGWLPRKRLRMSTMPRLHWPKPRLSCWHCVGRVSRRGGERHSRGVWRETRMHSEFCRHWASAAPVR